MDKLKYMFQNDKFIINNNLKKCSYIYSIDLI